MAQSGLDLHGLTGTHACDLVEGDLWLDVIVTGDRRIFRVIILTKV